MKQTEIGLIPDDWEVKEFKQEATLINGRAYAQSELLKQGKYKVLRVGNFGTNDNWYYSNLELPEKQYCTQGDLLYCWSCTYGAYIWNEPSTIYHYHIWKIISKGADKEYLKYILNNDTENQMKSSNGSTMAHITKGFLENRLFAFPPLAEQQRIAKALSDVDTLISTIEKLIQKKKNIKQGTMQNLLTGKKRLPGFAKSNKTKMTELGEIPEDWEVKELSDFGTFSKGSGISREESNTGEIPAVRYGELYTTHDDYIKSFYSHISDEVASKSKKLKKGDLLFTCSGETKEDIGKCVAFIGNEKAYAGGDLLILSPTVNIDSLFYGFLLNTTVAVKQKSSMAQGDAVVHISAESVGKVQVPFPSKEEQTAIANVLSSTDKEIETLNTKLEKYRNLKTAMMQQLLTGKIRLFASETAEAISDKKQRAPNPFFKRSVLAAEIVDRLHDEPTFGHVKLQKLIFLAERMCGIDIDSSYHRDAAGPYDNYGLRSIDSQLEKQKWFSVEHTENAYHYIPLENQGGHRQYFERYFADKQDTFDLIIKTFKTAKTEQCEIVATLYSAWEDFLKKGITPTDDQIIIEVLTNWHESKTRIEKSRWISALNWMKENGFVPQV